MSYLLRKNQTKCFLLIPDFKYLHICTVTDAYYVNVACARIFLLLLSQQKSHALIYFVYFYSDSFFLFVRKKTKLDSNNWNLLLKILRCSAKKCPPQRRHTGHFVKKNWDPTYCNFFSSKLYFSANITKFIKQLSLKQFQEHILSMSKSKHTLS